MSSTNTPPGNTPNRSRSNSDLSGNAAPKKFMNGWTTQQEALMAEWSDKAACYRWLHDRCEKKFSRLNMFITIPVIILSTLTGTANFAVGSFIPPDNPALKNYVAAGIGSISIFAGILTTLGNYLRDAQGSEANRVASIAWGKFQRQIAIELAMHPNDRMDCMDFLGICRAELDRLIEQSPPVPDEVIEEFEKEFKDVPNIKRPDICHGLEHTRVFDSSSSRLKMLSGEAALMLFHKKKALRDEIIPDLTKLIDKRITDLSGSLMPHASQTVDRISSSQSLMKPSAKSQHHDATRRRVNLNTLVTPGSDQTDIHIDIVGAEKAEMKS